jgi:putative hydrolase of HD superfamily
MNRPDENLYLIQQMLVGLSLIERKNYLGDTDRHENDIEHSLTVAILAWYIHDKFNLELDIAKILKYALTHDFVERYAGDVSTFASQAEREEKVVREHESLERISGELKDFKDMITHMKDYEDKLDEESLFIWSVDKMQQLIMGDIAKWRSFKRDHIMYPQFAEKYEELLQRSSRYCKEIFEGLVEYSKLTFYDKTR